MSLSIGASLAAQTFALDDESSSRVLYNGHAGLGADLIGQPRDASLHERSLDSCENASQWYRPEADDEVLVSFARGESRRPFVIAALWDSNAAPAQDSVAPEVKHPERLVPGAASHLDSMSEMGETESLRLRMAMDRLSKMMSTLSNVLQRIEETQAAITENIK